MQGSLTSINCRALAMSKRLLQGMTSAPTHPSPGRVHTCSMKSQLCYSLKRIFIFQTSSTSIPMSRSCRSHNMSVGDNSVADSITSTPTLRLDAHTRPPDNLRLAFKKWQKSSQVSLTSSKDLIDTISPSSDDRLKEQAVSDHDVMRFEDACRLFMADKTSLVSRSKIQCFEIKTLPGGPL